ncbi:hypothetical protein [Deinococcus misasensis]|uniref:hypothetical protein n=1 Tax=Deinococcus misasensis TaxID=392413 RepID=UPI0005525485|nr:hypothetical protein [Deinococcus misasensis]
MIKATVGQDLQVKTSLQLAAQRFDHADSQFAFTGMAFAFPYGKRPGKSNFADQQVDHQVQTVLAIDVGHGQLWKLAFFVK